MPSSVGGVAVRTTRTDLTSGACAPDVAVARKTIPPSTARQGRGCRPETRRGERRGEFMSAPYALLRARRRERPAGRPREQGLEGEARILLAHLCLELRRGRRARPESLE